VNTGEAFEDARFIVCWSGVERAAKAHAKVAVVRMIKRRRVLLCLGI
jgi:hypothetical protein